MMHLLSTKPKSSGWLDAGENKAVANSASCDQDKSIRRRMSNDAILQGSPVIQQVVDALYLLGQITPSGFQDSCNTTAQVLLSQLSDSGVASLSIFTHTCSSPNVCVLAGAAGLGAEIMQKQLVLSGSRWAPCLCGTQLCGPFLYRTVLQPEDAVQLPQDWAELHRNAGLNTFLAAHITEAGQDKPFGILCIASTAQATFMDESWGLQISMITTGLVPLLTSPWLSGLSSLAARLAAHASDNFSNFAAAFLQGAVSLLESTTHRRLGVRLGLLSEDQQEVLLLYRDNSSIGSGRDNGRPVLCEDSAYEQSSQRAFAVLAAMDTDIDSPHQLHSVRISAAHTLLLDAVQTGRTCFVPDMRSCLEDDGMSAPPDIMGLDDEIVSSIAVVPLFGPSIRRRRSSSSSTGSNASASSSASTMRSGGNAAATATGGLYVTCQETGGFLNHKPVVMELAAMLQHLLLQQEFVQLPESLEDVQACPSGASMSSSSNILSGESNLSSSSAATGAAPNHNANLVVLQRAWQLQDKQQACASEYLCELQLHAELDKGGFSTVYDGTWQGSRTAVKVMNVPKDGKLGIPIKSAMEMATLSTLRHPNIVTTYACFTDMVAERQSCNSNTTPTSDGSGSGSDSDSSGKLIGHCFRKACRADMADDCKDIYNIVVMERCDRGSLWRAVKQEMLLHRHLPGGRQAVNMRLLYTVLLDVAQSLRYLHSMGLVHCDIKAENVLLQTATGQPNGFTCKLGDFGLVKLLGDKSTYLMNKDTSGTLTHLAPERLHAGGLITTAVDVFGFGVLMYELYACQKPYRGMQRDLDLAKAVFHGLRPQFPESTPLAFRQLAESCWVKGFADRPCFDVITQRLQEQLEVVIKQSKSCKGQ